MHHAPAGAGSPGAALSRVSDLPRGGPCSSTHELRLASLGERHLDHVEVARDDRRREHVLRLARAARAPKYRGETCVSASSRTPASPRSLGGLARGRVQRVGGAIALVLAERRLVHEHVRALGERTHRLDGRGVAGDDDATAGPCGPTTSSGVEHPSVGERDRLAALQCASLGPERDRRARRRSSLSNRPGRSSSTSA